MAVTPSTALHRRYQDWYWRQHLRRFFAPFVGAGDLVFDIGAHTGLWTGALAGLGCHVVAVEPQQACASAIATAARGGKVTVVVAAIGAEPGETNLFLAPQTTMASTAADWMNAMVERGGVPPDYWRESVRVPVRTLDGLVDEFGVPVYVKLDVEGSEGAALEGLSVPVRLVSFETHGQALDDAHRAVARLSELGRYEFNLSAGEFQKLSWPRWGSGNDVLAELELVSAGWNNVFARLSAFA